MLAGHDQIRAERPGTLQRGQVRRTMTYREGHSRALQAEPGDRPAHACGGSGFLPRPDVTDDGFRHVGPAQVPALLRRATILALPNPASAISTHFTSPLKLFEYMAAGRAIVASDLPAIREVLRHEVNALLVTPGDSTAFAQGIERLLADGELAARLARNALNDVDDYTWSRRAERLEALFDI